MMQKVNNILGGTKMDINTVKKKMEELEQQKTQLEKEHIQLSQRLEQINADYQACFGGIQICEMFIKDEKENPKYLGSGNSKKPKLVEKPTFNSNEKNKES